MDPIKVKLGTPYEMDAWQRPSFDEWMRAIENLIWKLRGISVYDLPDCPFDEWYDERLRPIRAANKALRRAGAFRE